MLFLFKTSLYLVSISFFIISTLFSKIFTSYASSILLRELIKDGYILEGMPQNIDLETQDAEENLKDINRQIQEEYDKQKELGFRYDT